jgi:predicted metal-dependent phosphoesterase TrpH
MCKLKRIDCIAITDHDKLENALYYAPFFLKHRIQIIPGEEIMTENGEIIGLFLKNWIRPGMTPTETVKEIQAQGGLVYIPHPYDKKRQRTVLDLKSLADIQDWVQMMECHNGRNSDPFFSVTQNAMCEQWGFPKVVGSDAHTFLEIGRNYLVMEPFLTSEEFLERLSHATLVKKRPVTGIHIITRWVKLLKMLRIGDISGIFRAFLGKYKKL